MRPPLENAPVLSKCRQLWYSLSIFFSPVSENKIKISLHSHSHFIQNNTDGSGRYSLSVLIQTHVFMRIHAKKHQMAKLEISTPGKADRLLIILAHRLDWNSQRKSL